MIKTGPNQIIFGFGQLHWIPTHQHEGKISFITWLLVGALNMLCDHSNDLVCVEKRLEGIHTILLDGHRLSRHRAKVKPGEKPVLLMAKINIQLFDCCLTAWIFSDKVCGQSQAFSGAVRVVEVCLAKLEIPLKK